MLVAGERHGSLQMTKSDQSDAAALNMRSPEWLSRHGTTFEWTQADQEIFGKEYQSYIQDQSATQPRSFSAYVAIALVLILLCTLISSAVIIIAIIRELYEGEIYEWHIITLVVGMILGYAISSILMASLIFLRARGLATLDPKWSFTTTRVGVDCGVLWQYKHGTIAIYTSAKAFVDVQETSHLILAFINKTAAHPFPREKLAATDEGRKVLNWFAANWPDSVGPDSPSANRPVARRVKRRVSFALRGIAAIIVTMAIIAGADFLGERWRAAHTAKLSPPSASVQPDGAAPRSSDRNSDPGSVTLSGQGAADFLSHMMHPETR